MLLLHFNSDINRFDLGLKLFKGVHIGSGVFQRTWVSNFTTGYEVTLLQKVNVARLGKRSAVPTGNQAKEHSTANNH